MSGNYVKYCIVAGRGRMGQTLLQIALRQEGKAAGARQPKKNTSIVKRPSQTSASDPSFLTLRSVYVRKSSNLEGQPALDREHEARYFTRLADAVECADVVIDFSTPSLSLQVLRECQRQEKMAVIGTTGLNEEQRACVFETGKHVPILFASNTSLGVNVLFLLTDLCRKLWEGKMVLQDWDACIVDLHHKHKKDKPSGTALALAEIMGKGLVDPENIQAVRVSEVIGEHRVSLCGPQESLEIIHRAHSRDVFANGALLGARLLWEKRTTAPRVYSMREILQFEVSQQ